MAMLAHDCGSLGTDCLVTESCAFVTDGNDADVFSHRLLIPPSLKILPNSEPSRDYGEAKDHFGYESRDGYGQPGQSRFFAANPRSAGLPEADPAADLH